MSYTMPSRHQVARVAVDNEQWLAFRQAGLARGLSVSAYLGQLVRAELSRRKGRAAAGIKAEEPETDQALAALSEVRASISELDAIAGRLARSAVAHGASWDDVASSLRIPPAQAEGAYQTGTPPTA